MAITVGSSDEFGLTGNNRMNGLIIPDECRESNGRSSWRRKFSRWRINKGKIIVMDKTEGPRVEQH